jgi:hypothetical protein
MVYFTVLFSLPTTPRPPNYNLSSIPEIETPGIEVLPVPIQPGIKPVPIPVQTQPQGDQPSFLSGLMAKLTAYF